MHEIHIARIADDFFRCWQAAGMHLQNQVQDAVIYWLRAHLSPPFLEHLSFRLGNQLFFIRLEDVDQRLEMPGSHEGLLSIAKGCNGYACILPMRKSGSEWKTNTSEGWGLIDAITRKEINPFNLVDDKPLQMTDWELHDMAVQIVRQNLEKDGFKITSWQGIPHVDPSLWIQGANGPEWVVVREALYPAKKAMLPANMDEIAKNCLPMSKVGHFASVAIANHDDNNLLLYRGHAMYIRYEGLQDYSSQ